MRTYNTTGTTAVIASLIPSYEYKISVAAYTVAIGPFTAFVNVTLPEDSEFFIVIIHREVLFIISP